MKKFTDLDLPEFLQEALLKINFVDTTPVQRQAIPILIQGKDLIACAQTGSGKTAAYLIPIVKELLENKDSNALVMAPTRELAQQIADMLKELVPNEREFPVARLVGGMDIRKQFKSLQRRPRVIVATPGRLIDHLKRNTVQINKTNRLVLDEGDRMIDMGFAPQLQQILKHLPAERQTSFFTATMDNKVILLANKYLNKPQKIMIGESRPVSTIKQSVIQVEAKDKDECIVHELNSREGSVIIFVKTKIRTDRLQKYLSDYGFDADVIHGGLTQGQRNRAINGFKKGKSRILCATDVAARGLDVPHVEHVINFDIPMMDEDYVHRIGRTARNGAEGEAVSFITPHEHNDWNRIVKKYQIADAMLEPSKGGGRSGRGRKQTTRSSGGRGDSRRGDSRGGSSRSAGSGRSDDRRSSSKRGESRWEESEKSDSRKSASKRGDSKWGDSKRSDSKRSDSKWADSKKSDSKRSDSKRSDSKWADSKKSDSKRSDSKRSDSKWGDSKKSDSKRSDSKRSDSKWGDSKKSASSREDSRDDFSKKKRARSVTPNGDGSIFKKKTAKGKTFKKAGGFKKSRAKQMSSRG